AVVGHCAPIGDRTRRPVLSGHELNVIDITQGELGTTAYVTCDHNRANDVHYVQSVDRSKLFTFPAVHHLDDICDTRTERFRTTCNAPKTLDGGTVRADTDRRIREGFA